MPIDETGAYYGGASSNTQISNITPENDGFLGLDEIASQSGLTRLVGEHGELDFDRLLTLELESARLADMEAGLEDIHPDYRSEYQQKIERLRLGLDALLQERTENPLNDVELAVVGAFSICKELFLQRARDGFRGQYYALMHNIVGAAKRANINEAASAARRRDLFDKLSGVQTIVSR